jgi:hypothetical protein
MSLNPKLAVARRNAALDLILAQANSGFLDIYDGTQAADADTAVGAQVKLAHLPMGSTAFAAASGGVASANAITGATALATGTATWYRLTKSDGTAIMDGSVGTATANLVLNSVAMQSGAAVSCSSFAVTFPA